MRDNGGVPQDPRNDSVAHATDPDASPIDHEELEPTPADALVSDRVDHPTGSEDDGPISEEVEVESEHEVKVRRTPRWGRFMILGGAVFGIAAFIATYSLPQGTGYDRNTVFGFVLVGSVAVGVGIGALAAILASAATRHTERTVVADRVAVRRVEVSDEDSELPDLGELPSEPEPEPDDAERDSDAGDRKPGDD